MLARRLRAVAVVQVLMDFGFVQEYETVVVNQSFAVFLSFAGNR